MALLAYRIYPAAWALTQAVACIFSELTGVPESVGSPAREVDKDVEKSTYLQ